jgi:hypothetical protein
MPFNGSGTATGVGRPQYPPQSGEIIYAAYFTAIIDDILAMLSNCVTRDGQSPLAQSLPANSKKIIGLGPGTASGDAIAMGQTGATLGSLQVTTMTGVSSLDGGPNFPTAPRVPTGIDGTGGSNAASQQYVEVAAARAATQVIPTVSAGAEALAIFNFMGA